MPVYLQLLLATAVSTNHRRHLNQPPIGDPLARSQWLQNRYEQIKIDNRGFVVSITSKSSKREYSPANHPSPLLSLHRVNQPYPQLVSPIAASFRPNKHEIVLTYPGKTTAVVKAVAKDSYFRFQLVSLTPRRDVDNVVWGPVNTSINKTVGDLIGVVSDDDWAIGMIGLNDNTIAGPPVDGDCYGMGYYVHSSDPLNHPVPKPYQEGQWFNIGGDGVSDTAFYSHPEEYFRQVFGNGAKLEPAFGSTIAYHSRDRRRPYTHLFSLLPGFAGSRPRHQISDPVDVDFIGSAVAIYGCPADKGLSTIDGILKSEGLPRPIVDGKWIHDPTTYKPDIAWFGPHDKLIEYADALGLKAVQDEGQGEYYANPVDYWQGKRVGFSKGPSLTYRQFTDLTNKHGIKYGLHTLCLFLQPGRNTDVTPTANANLQTVLRTKLAKDISPKDIDVVVTDPSFLAEDGTWPMRDGSNCLRIGGELLTYTGISNTNTLLGVKRGYAGTKPVSHQAQDELDKLQMNCYNGFCPDMKLMPTYADYYATVMAENGMEYIDFDGLESTLYQNQGYFAVRTFFRRLFDTYGKLTGGRAPRVMGSCVFAGGWEYMSVCNVGGGNNMFDPILNRWGIEGKDVRNGLESSFFPATFGIQDYHSDWTEYDAENLEAKSVGFGATYMLGLNQDAVERSGEKHSIFKAFKAWENARAAGVFTPRIKEQLKRLDTKFHLDQTGKTTFTLFPIQELRIAGISGPEPTQVPFTSLPASFALRVSRPVNRCQIVLPDGRQITCQHKIEAGQFMVYGNDQAYLADKNRNRITALLLDGNRHPSQAHSILTVQLQTETNTPVRFDLTSWISGKPELLGHR